MSSPKEENGEQSGTPEYRDRLRTWLIKMIDSGTIAGLQWENEEKTIFRMPWKHAGRQDYSLEADSRIFMAWAIHSGRYREGIDKPEPIIWKTRLRCALNKMPDIREIPERSRLDISEPYRVYHLLPPIHKDTQIRRRLQRRHSHAQHSETIRAPAQRSPTSYSCKDSTAKSAEEMKFQSHCVQARPSETTRGVTRSELNPQTRLDVRNTGPWLASPLVQSSENRLLRGLNLNCLSSPIGVGNLVNPYSLFPVPHRDLRHRPEFDLPLFPYAQAPVLDQTLNPFLPPSSLGGLPTGNPSLTSPFSRSLALAATAADEYHRRNNMNKVRVEEKDEAKYKIELLEVEALQWKRAYEKEHAMREAIEQKYEQFKTAIENMGVGLLAVSKGHHLHGMAKNDEDRGVQSKSKNSTKNARETSPERPFRRRSAEYNQKFDSFPTERTERSARSGRYSAGELSTRAKNDFQTPLNRKRSIEEEDHSKNAPLDLTSPTPSKLVKEESSSICQMGVGQNYKYCEDATKDDSESNISKSKSENRIFRFSATSSRISSDYDEAEATSTTSAQPLIESPSTSGCSSAEESHIGSSMSPSITRASPIIPLFRHSNSNYSTRADDAIHVT